MKLIILDRDGVINYDSEYYIKSPEEWLPIPGSLAAIGKLKQLGYQIAIATNQSGIARGLYTEATLAAIHQKMQNLLKDYGGSIDFICYCPHHPDEHCDCRKPKTGMFKTIAAHFGCPLEGVYFVGDSYSDILAAQAMHCIPVLVKTSKGEKTLEQCCQQNQEIQVFNNLAEFVESL